MLDSKKHSLFILSCNYARISEALSELSEVMDKNDILLLIDDSVHALNISAIHTFQSIKVLEQDAYLIPDGFNQKINKINYLQFAELIHQSNKVITWK